MARPGHRIQTGQLALLDMRQDAEEALGERFDLREFHEAVLMNGAMPLDILKDNLAEWAARSNRCERLTDRRESVRTHHIGCLSLFPRAERHTITAACGSLEIAAAQFDQLIAIRPAATVKVSAPVKGVLSA